VDRFINDHFNRRKHPRTRVFQKARYIGYDGQSRRSELINTSSQGARLTTSNEVRVGDRLTILNEASSGFEPEISAEVKWTRALPGGIRQVVGVQTEAAPAG